VKVPPASRAGNSPRSAKFPRPPKPPNPRPRLDNKLADTPISTKQPVKR